MPVGTNSFEFESPAPDPTKIPENDLLGVAALILTGSYNDQEFVRVGYYQNTEYDTEELRAEPPSRVKFDRLVRDVNMKPRVTRFQIKWYVVSLTLFLTLDRKRADGELDSGTLLLSKRYKRLLVRRSRLRCPQRMTWQMMMIEWMHSPSRCLYHDESVGYTCVSHP